MTERSAGAAADGLLPELPEAQASGEQRRIYAEIKRLSAVPMVALIYRHLATIPGALEWAWALVEPAMQSGRLQQCAWRLAAGAAIPGRRTIPRAALHVAGIGPHEEAAITQVLDAYNRANPVNMMVVGCVARHLAGTVATPIEAQPQATWQPPPPPPSLPPMIDPAAMQGPVRELALLLTDRSDGRAASPLWPSLYRHLANWPAMLGYASVLVVPEFAAIDESTGRLREQAASAATELAKTLAPPPGLAPPEAAQREGLQSAIERFGRRIPEMVVIGGLLRRALPAQVSAREDGSS